MTQNNIEDFKKNLITLDKSLFDDSSEPSNDLYLVGTWIDYVQRGDATPEQTAYIVKEWIPKLVKTVLTRKYDWNRTTYGKVTAFFERLTIFLTVNLHEDHEGVYQALKELLDPNQPFYTKYCAMQSDQSGDPLPQLVDVPEFANVDQLSPGDYIDCLNKVGRWEMAQIDQFSDYRTEFQVIWPDDHREWLSMDRDRHRMATFGTKSMSADETPAAPASANSENNSNNANSTPSGQGGDRAVLDVTDQSWKAEVEVGSLLDARDTAQVWYQACIMEIKTETVVTSTVPSTPVLSITTAASTSIPHSSSLDDMYEENLSSSAVTTPLGRSVSTTPVPTVSGQVVPSALVSSVSTSSSAGEMAVDETPIDFTEPETKNPQGDAAPSTESTPEPTEAAPAVQATSTEVSTTKIVARVAFLGLPERLDEWIELSSDRLQKINSCSFGRRGKLVGVRDEIIFLAKRVPSQQGEIGKFAIFREGCFAQPLYIQLVNVFGGHSGFGVIEEKLRAAVQKVSGTTQDVQATAPSSAAENSVSPRREITPTATLTGLLNLVTLVGGMHRVLTKSFLAEFGPPFLELARGVLLQLSLSDIRETPIESLEPALAALEQIAVAHYGPNAATGRLLDPLKLEVALQTLRCPFLNRRLGGLKILSELVRRAENSRDYPTGLKVTRSMANNVEEVSYRVMPVLFHFTLRTLCENLHTCEAIAQIFVGDNAHESLMSRASSLISAMASQQCLGNDLLQAMWTAGFVENKPEALQCLSNVMTGLPLEDGHVQFVLRSVRALEAHALSRSVVDIVTALALRCRDCLMSGGLLAAEEAEACYAIVEQVALFDDLSSTPSPMDVVRDDASVSSTPAKPTAELLRLVFRIHTQTLLILWEWTADQSGASEEVVAACFEKIELVLRPGKTVFDALKDPDFPWTMQWFRSSKLVELAVTRLRKPESPYSVIKALQMTLNAWPQASTATQPGMKDLPFVTASKGELMAYLELEYHIIVLVTNASLLLKENFNAHFLTTAKTAEWGSDISKVADVNSQIVLGAEVEEALNATKLVGARQSYTTQLSMLFDFLHVAVRCNPTLDIPRETVFELWRAIVLNPVTSEEADIVINFYHRLINKTSDSASSTSTSTSTGASTASDVPTRSAVSSRNVLLAAFAELLCDRERFLQSRFFSTKSLQCVEKWFRWLNSDLSYGENSGADSDKSKSSSFNATDDPDKLIGVDVFPDIILTCHSDKVASAAVTFLTTLPATLAKWARNADSAVVFRKSLLGRCMAELSASVTQSTGGVRLSRALLFLDGILEESLSNSDGGVALHGTLGRGNPITFHVTSPTKALKEFEGDVMLYMNETVQALFEAVATQMRISVAEVKIFRLGNVLNLKSEGGKILSQLKSINVGEKERLVVTKHPAPKLGASTIVPVTVAEEGDLTEIVRVNSKEDVINALPVLVLSHTPEYFDLLFTLMHGAQGEVCDRLWSLVTRIPTSTAVLTRWLELEGSQASSIFNEYGANKVGKLSTLLYHLQVVEMLLQPAVSAEDLELQLRFIKDVDHKLLASWPERFVQKNGLGCLCQAFEWVKNALNYFLISPNGNLPGVTANLLQKVAALVSKLLRAFYVRIAARPSSAHLASVGGALNDLKYKDSTDIHAPRSRLRPAATSSSTTATATEAPIEAPSKTDFVAVALQAEWGWRIDLHVDRLVVPDAPPLISEDTIVTLAVLVRKLAEHSVFNCPSSADSAVRSAKAAKRDAITASLDSLLLVWTCVSISSLHAPKRRTVDSRRIVREFILGDASDLIPQKEPQLSVEGYGIGSEWFVEAVGAYILWLSSLDAVTSAAQPSPDSPRAVNKLTTELLLTVLELRPSLIAVDGTAASTSSVSMKPLFLLATALLDGPSAANLTIPNEVCKTASDQILTELEAVGKELKAAALLADAPQSTLSSQVAYPNLEGTVMLFVALSSRDEEAMQVLGKQESLDFILYDCLGLVGMSACKQPIICEEERTRKHTYHLLKELVDRNAVRSQAVYRALAAVHAELPTPLTWEYRPQRESRSATGYVGLRNLGSTCYMNSLLQVLFMNPAVREYLLTELSFDTESEDELRDNIAFQLKKMFYSLKHSEKKSFSPTDWTFAFKDEMGCNPMNVMLQQDAQEFLQLLSERFERSIQEKQQTLRHVHGAAAVLPVDILHRTFGGQLCNQMFKSKATTADSTAAPVSRDIREQNEGFVCISLEVKGCVNLERSLSKFVEGEQIGGYLWEEGAPRENITKRQCIAQLSDTLIFHLKRFELNFDTFRREKVNDAFAFPLRINMRRYTKEGLAEAEGWAADSASGAQANAEEDCEYELGGVIVHTGTTESGHYFAYIKEPNCADSTTSANSRWCEFNDAEVTPFSPALLESETFGGKTFAHDLYSGGQNVVTTEIVNPKSAYMLIYNRVPKPSSRMDLSQLADASPLAAESVKTGSVMQKYIAQLETENAQHRLSIRILNEHHLSFVNNLMDALHRHAVAQHQVLSGEQLSAFVRFVTQFVAHTAHSSVLKDACADVRKYLASHKVLLLQNAPRSLSGSSSAPPTPRVAKAIVPEHNKENDAPLPVPPQVDSAPASLTATGDATSASTSPNDLILSAWLQSIDAELGALYAPKEEVRKSLAEIVLHVLELAVVQHGKAPFSSPEVDLNAGLLSTSFGAAMMTVAALAAKSTTTFKPVVSNIYSIPEDIEVGEAEPVDEDLLLAIQMSQEASSGSANKGEGLSKLEIVPGPEVEEVSSVPVEAVIAADAPPAPASSPTSIAKTENNNILAPSIPKTAPVGVAPTAPVDTSAKLPASPLLAPTFLLALTNDVQMQLIAENWRKSQSVLWLLLEVARLGSAQKAFLLKRELVAHLVDTLLGDQCPLSGMIYPKGSRRRAPSSYVTVVPGKDGSQPFVAKNLPDWTHLIELLSVLVCASDSLALGQSMGELSLQCVQTKTLYSTIFRQARYVPPAIPMIVHLCYENKPFSDLIGEALCEEMSLANYDTCAHLFQVLERFLGINDSFAHARNFQLFGGGDFNLLETMRITKDQPTKHRFVCVFIRSFLALAEKVVPLRDLLAVPSSKAASWAPWMLKFCFRFTNKCNQEAALLDLPQMTSEKSQINQAIRATGTGTSTGAAHSVSFAPIATTCAPASGAGGDATSSTSNLSRGPYVRVYGENPVDECNQTWVERAERTSQLLHSFLVNVGASPDALLPADTFDDDDMPALVAPAAVITGHSGSVQGPKQPSGHESFATNALADGMSDEELMQLLSSGNL